MLPEERGKAYAELGLDVICEKDEQEGKYDWKIRVDISSYSEDSKEGRVAVVTVYYCCCVVVLR